MLTSQRKQLILARLQKDGEIIAKNLSFELGLSEDTIRRDLRELASEGKLQRVHGGALPASPALANFAGRLQLATAGKIAIAKKAAHLIENGQVVILDGGTTAVQLARHLRPSLRATIVTHSPSVAVELAAHPHVEVIIIGGKLFKHSVVAMGPTALDQLSLLRADTYFMGVTGVHPDAGLTTGDFDEAATKRALSRRAAETIVLASAEKLGTASPYLVIPCTGLSGLVTEPALSPKLLQPYRDLGIPVIEA